MNLPPANHEVNESFDLKHLIELANMYRQGDEKVFKTLSEVKREASGYLSRMGDEVMGVNLFAKIGQDIYLISIDKENNAKELWNFGPLLH